VVHPNHHGQQLIVKFAHDSGVRVRGGIFVAPRESADVNDANISAAEFGASLAPLLQLEEAQLDAWRVAAESRSGIQLHDLNLFFLANVDGPEQVAELCDAFNRLELVELAYPVGTLSDPVIDQRSRFPEWNSTVSAASGFAKMPAAVLGTIASGHWMQPNAPLMPTPDFENLQGYREAAPLGIDANYGQTFSGSRGEGTVIADVETGWTDNHEDIKHTALGNFIGLIPAPYPWDHGTAVLGELVGEDNGEGVKGIVHQADVLMSSHLGSAANISTAIANAATAAGVGDVVVLEVQCFSGAPSPHPCEYDAATFATVQTAVAAGTHVFAAAGNGANDLDSPAYGGLFDRSVRDSGAVMCGASNGSSLDIAWFSNYGSRLDVHGWGFDVTTAAYGDLQGGPVEEEYTQTFSGTSSATPIVTGAGIMLSGIYREAYNMPISPDTLRTVLRSTGTPQGAGGQIGPRPDVRAGIAALAIPTLSVAGTLVPGGTADFTVTGSVGSRFVIAFANDLLATPAYNPPYGYLYLDTPTRTARGIIGAGGSTTLSFPIPPNPALSGTRIGFVQSRVNFAGPGVGTFTNYVPVDIM